MSYSSILKTISLLITCTLLSISSVASALIAYPDDNGSICAKILVVFARGSGQNDSNVHNASDAGLKQIYREAGVNNAEHQTAKFIEEFHKRLPTGVKYVSLHNQPSATGQTYNQYGYEAASAFDAISTPANSFGMPPKHRTDVANRYYESVKDGAEELAWYLEDQLTSCPLQQVVLGGYSQGAEVTMDGINMMQPEFRARIAYVALYGDPKFNPAQTIVPPKSGWWKRGNTIPITHGILDRRMPYVPDDLPQIGSWCASGDLICDAGGADINDLYRIIKKNVRFNNDTHSNIYQDKWIPESMPEITKAARDRLPGTDVNNSVYINKNDKLWDLDLAVVLDTANSMSGSLHTIKGNVTGLSGELLGSYWNSRVGLVTYNGTPAAEEPGHVYSQVVTPFTNDQNDIRQGFQSISAEAPHYNFMPDGSHYLAPELSAQYAGIMTAIQDLQWEHGAQKKIIVITNNQAASHDPSPNHWTPDQVSKAARDLDPAVLNLANVSCDDAWSCNQDINNEFQQLADNSGGQLNNVDLAFGTIDDLSGMLEQMEMQPVADITGDQAGYVNYPLQFSASESYDPNSPLNEYDWDCDSDGHWDFTTTDPNGSCIYGQPYDGMVTMRAWTGENSQGAYATLHIKVIPGIPPALATPEKPNATLSYNSDAIKIAWSNTYLTNTFVKVSDNQDNLLGYAPTSASYVTLQGIGDQVPEVHISACLSITNCSESSTLTLTKDAVDNLSEPTDDTPTFSIPLNQEDGPPSVFDTSADGQISGQPSQPVAQAALTRQASLVPVGSSTFGATTQNEPGNGNSGASSTKIPAHDTKSQTAASITRKPAKYSFLAMATIFAAIGIGWVLYRSLTRK
jgi:hypothetical protein